MQAIRWAAARRAGIRSTPRAPYPKPYRAGSSKYCGLRYAANSLRRRAFAYFIAKYYQRASCQLQPGHTARVHVVLCPLSHVVARNKHAIVRRYELNIRPISNKTKHYFGRQIKEHFEKQFKTVLCFINMRCAAIIKIRRKKTKKYRQKKAHVDTV